MKILESQNAVLTNFEVYQHLVAEQRKYPGNNPHLKRKMPDNLHTVVKEVLYYLRTAPSPLSQKPLTYDADSIARLVERFRDYDLTKGEMIMIINQRPANGAQLDACVEDMFDRFTEDQQNEMLEIIAEVLGSPPPREEEPDEGEGAAA